MTLDELDKNLAQLRAELDAIRTNLLELDDMTVVRLMKDKADQLQGKTREKVRHALEAVSRLWVEFGALEGVCDKAEAARKNLPKWRQGKAIEEIEKILSADIQLDSEEVPFDQRGLFSGAERKHMVSPGQLKEMMARSFESAKKIFIELQNKITTLHDQYETVKAEAESLKREAESFGKGVPAAVTDLLARLESTNKRRRRDLLSVTSDLALDMQPYLEKARAAVAELARERDKIRKDVDRAGRRLEEIAELYKQSLKRSDAGTVTKPLSDRLEELKKALSEEKWATVGAGIGQWHEECKVVRELILALRQACERLEQVKILRTQCLQLYKNCETEIDNPQGLVAPVGTKSLAEWLDTLMRALSEGRQEAARTGLSEWSRECEALGASIQSAVQANQRPLEKKQELARRWAEAQRKTEEFEGKGLVVDKALTTFGNKAEELMSASKVNLEEAEQMIYSYETRLAGLISLL